MVIAAILSCVLLLSGDTGSNPDLSLKVVISRDHYMRTKWDNTLSSEGVNLTSGSKFYQGESAYILVFLRNMKTTKAGTCDVKMDIALTGPDGDEEKIVKDIQAKDGLVGAPTNVYLADPIIGLILDEDEAFGEYEIVVTARDEVGHQTIKASAKYSLVKYGQDHHDLARDEAQKRMMSYHERPNSHLIFEFFKVVLDDTARSRGNGWPMMSGPFFRQVFRDNPYQLPHLKSNLKSLTNDQIIFLLPMLKGIFEDHPELLEGLPEAVDARKRIQKIEYPDIWDADITSPQELDMLWMHFFATGDIKPIRKLATALSLASDDHDRMKQAIGKSAIWSIGSNCKQHKLVRNYCEYLASKATELDDVTRLMLAELTKPPTG